VSARFFRQNRRAASKQLKMTRFGVSGAHSESLAACEFGVLHRLSFAFKARVVGRWSGLSAGNPVKRTGERSCSKATGRLEANKFTDFTLVMRPATANPPGQNIHAYEECSFFG
jgi:hypothetical protein